MPATVAIVSVMVVAVMGVQRAAAAATGWSEEWQRPHHAPMSYLTQPVGVLNPQYTDAFHIPPQRVMKALSPRLRPRDTITVEVPGLPPSSSEEILKPPSSSEEMLLPPSSSEEIVAILPSTTTRPLTVHPVTPVDDTEVATTTPPPPPPPPPPPKSSTTPPPPPPSPPPRRKKPRRKVISITRHYKGDIYSLAAGRRGCGCEDGGSVGPGEECQCQCPASTPTFRDDTSVCVATLHECILADFVSSSDAEKIPYVYLPLKHQLVHPTAEVALRGLEHGGLPIMSPVCVVTGASILTQKGWRNMANTSTLEPPFRLFRDVGRTFVQWVGEAEARRAAEGRLVLVTLICRDAAQPATPVFRPCLAFRVAGSPGSSGALSATPAPADGAWEELSWGDGVIIGLVVACLTVIYVVGMTVFIQYKRKKKKEKTIGRHGEEGGNMGNRKGGRERGRPRSSLKSSSLLVVPDDAEDIEDLSLASRARRANRERNHITYTSALVHTNSGLVTHEAADGMERVPRSPLAVVTLAGDADTGTGMNRNIPDGGVVVAPGENQEAQVRKKLYFNPAYFEPELLQSPPPAAVEFLTRIREMITVAKTKMKTKTYYPSLGDIPEEDSDCQSCPVSRTVSGTTVHTEDVQEEATNASDVTSIQSDSLERRSKENDNRSSTLKRLARRVNSHGESFVSEIIKTLDLKPRLPQNDGSFVPSPVLKASNAHKAPAPPPPKPVNARNESPDVEDDFPELIKPSMLRSVLRDGKRLTDLNNTFENFRQEMMATFQKMKRVGEAISPKSTLNRNKKKSKSSPKSTLERLESEKEASSSSTGEGKVQKWLQTLDGKNTYTRMMEQPNTASSSKMVLPEDVPPPLPEKNSKPPTPPRKHRTAALRSVSFSEARQHGSVHQTHSDPASHDRFSDKSQVTRSLSWQNEHQHYDSNPRRRRPQLPMAPDENLNTSFGSEDDSLNDLVSEAESKVPKMTPSDSESIYSDTRSRGTDSLQRRTEELEGHSKTHFGQLPQEEAMTARNEIYNKRTGTKTMSRLAKNENESYSKVADRLSENDYEDHNDHTYEEIHFPSRDQEKRKRKAPQISSESKTSGEKSKLFKGGERTRSKHESSGKRNTEGTGVGKQDSQYIFSNPDSMVSEVTIDKCNSPIYSGCKVTIPVADNVEMDTCEPGEKFDQDTLERRSKEVTRNGSIALDSLERPKLKSKNNNNTTTTTTNNNNSRSNNNNNNNNNEERTESSKVKRRMTLPGEMPPKGDKSLLDIYESRSSVRSAKSVGRGSLEGPYSPMKFTSSPALEKSGSFYLSNINNANNTNAKNMINNNTNDNKNRGEVAKKYRTFKDYQDMRFLRHSAETESITSSGSTSSSPLPVTGTSICVNFHDSSSSSSSREQGDIRPPLPPKQTRNYDSYEIDARDVPLRLPPKTRTAPPPPPLPLKSSKKYDQEDTTTNPPRLPEKSYRRSSQETSPTRSSSSGSIPELTEEEARAILHGLLAHTPHEGHRLSTLHEEDDVSGSFLGGGNTADDSNSAGSVPYLDAFSSGSLESPPSTPTSSLPSPHSSMTQPHDQGFAMQGVLYRGEYGEEPQSPGSEARVSGEFILSSIGRSTSLRRHSSLSKEQTNSFMSRRRGATDGECDDEGEAKGTEFSLASKAKSDLEKHFKDESGGESIKRTWRKILEKVDDPQEGQSHLTETQVQQAIVAIGPKVKQDDSGYHSTDSSESAQSRNPSQNSSVSSTSVPLSTVSNGSRWLAKKAVSQSLSRSGLPKRSSSLNRMTSYTNLDTLPASSFQRSSLRASLSRSFPGVLGGSGGSSVYINNKFVQEDDDDDHFPARLF